jgi:hypothetical protein
VLAASERRAFAAIGLSPPTPVPADEVGSVKSVRCSPMG